MTIEQYILVSIAIILTCLFYKTRNILNAISQNITKDKAEQNKYEVVMQPKWLLNSAWMLTIFWLYVTYTLFQTKSWWALLYAVGFYFSSALIQKLLPFPSIRFLVDLFFATTSKRLANESRYNFIEIQYLKNAHEVLNKIRTPGSSLNK